MVGEINMNELNFKLTEFELKVIREHILHTSRTHGHYASFNTKVLRIVDKIDAQLKEQKSVDTLPEEGI